MVVESVAPPSLQNNVTTTAAGTDDSHLRQHQQFPLDPGDLHELQTPIDGAAINNQTKSTNSSSSGSEDSSAEDNDDDDESEQNNSDKDDQRDAYNTSTKSSPDVRKNC